MSWIDLVFAFESKLTSGKMSQVQGNFAALTQGLDDAPKIQSAAWDWMDVASKGLFYFSYNVWFEDVLGTSYRAMSNRTGSSFAKMGELLLYIPNSATSLEYCAEGFLLDSETDDYGEARLTTDTNTGSTIYVQGSSSPEWTSADSLGLIDISDKAGNGWTPFDLYMSEQSEEEFYLRRIAGRIF